MRSEIKGFVPLMKLRVVELLLVTTVPTMIVAEGLTLDIPLNYVARWDPFAVEANAINMYIDRDIDPLMERTRHRPLRNSKSAEALTFAISIEALAFLWLWLTVNLLSTVLRAHLLCLYLWLWQRTSSSNIVIGELTGAAPVLIGWTAVQNSRLASTYPFRLIYLWTPPHFWALAIRYRLFVS